MLAKKLERKFESYPAFTFRDAEIYLGSVGENTKNLARSLAHLKKTGRIVTIVRGVYTFNKDDLVLGHGYSPFYFGLLHAMSLREFWTLESRPEIITVRTVRRSRVHMLNDRIAVSVHHISGDRFFGYDFVKYGRFKVPVSDTEKTLIDLFYFDIKLPIQNYSIMLKSLKMKKLRKYLSKFDQKTKTKVLEFVSKYKKIADEGRLESPY